MARLASMRGTRGDLSVPRGTPVRGALYDADAFGRFSESLARFLGTGKYLGTVGFQRLLRRAPSVQIGDCIEDRLFVKPDLPERELAARLAAYNLIGVAVCDEAGRLVGAVTVDDVIDRLLPVGWRRIGGK